MANSRVDQDQASHSGEEYRLRLLDAVARVQALFIEHVDSDEVFETVSRSLVDLTESDLAVVAEVLYTPEGRPYLKPGSESVATLEVPYNGSHRIETDALESLFGPVLSSGSPERTSGTGSKISLGGISLDTFLGIPLLNGFHLIGVVGLGRKGVEYSEDLLETVRPLVDASTALITAFRANAERAQLADEQHRFFDLSIDMLCIAGADGYFKRVSPAFTQVLGHSEETLLGVPFVDFVHPEDVEATLGAAKKLGDGESIVDFENRYRCMDGTYRWVSWRAVAPDGGTIYAVARDVTDRKAEVAEYEEARNFLAGILGSSLDGMMVFKSIRNSRNEIVDFEWLLTNPTAEKIVGRTNDDLKGRRLLDEMPGNREAGLFDRYREVVETGESVEFEHKYTHEGFDTWFQNSVVAIGDGFAVTFADITEAKRTQQALAESERTLRSYLNSAPVGIFYAAPDGTCSFVNEHWVQLTGLSAEDARGDGWSKALHPDDAEMVFREWNKACESEESFSLEYRYVSTDGDVKWIYGTSVAVSDDTGEVVGYLGTATDITDRKMAEEWAARYTEEVEEARSQLERQAEQLIEQSTELEKARDAAEQATRMKSEFLAIMSHEIRTPMNGVLGMAGLLADTDLSEEQLDFVETIRSSGKALLEIINDILDFSKIEAGRISLEEVECDLLACAEESLELLADAARNKGLRTATVVRPDVPERIIGDPGRLRQVILNLVSNAIKFTDTGEVVVEVSRVESESDGCVLKFVIKDTGKGIAESALSRVFDAFEQEDSSTTREFGGTGLGLSICKKLTTLMGGEIGVNSEEGVGSEFWFTVKAHRAAGEPPTPFMEGDRVLVVEEHLASRRALTYRLETMGGIVTATGSDIPDTDFDVAFVSEEWLTNNDRGRLPERIVVLADPGHQGVGDFAMATLFRPMRSALLRRCLAEVVGADRRQSVRSGEEEAGPGGTEGKRVLLVEDNPVNQKVAVRMLRKMGCDVVVAVNGREAVERRFQGDFDIVIMDCRMPGMDGYEATREIRTRETNGDRVPIVAMTANVLEEERERCISSGMDDYLAKPVCAAQLREKVEHWVDRPASDLLTR